MKAVAFQDTKCVTITFRSSRDEKDSRDKNFGKTVKNVISS